MRDLRLDFGKTPERHWVFLALGVPHNTCGGLMSKTIADTAHNVNVVVCLVVDEVISTSEKLRESVGLLQAEGSHVCRERRYMKPYIIAQESSPAVNPSMTSVTELTSLFKLTSSLCFTSTEDKLQRRQTSFLSATE